MYVCLRICLVLSRAVSTRNYIKQNDNSFTEYPRRLLCRRLTKTRTQRNHIHAFTFTDKDVRQVRQVASRLTATQRTVGSHKTHTKSYLYTDKTQTQPHTHSIRKKCRDSADCEDFSVGDVDASETTTTTKTPTTPRKRSSFFFCTNQTRRANKLKSNRTIETTSHNNNNDNATTCLPVATE